MKVLFLSSAGGPSMRRSLRTAVSVAAPRAEVRMLAPDAEAKALRDLSIPTESWRPAGLFNVLRAINVLRRAVERFEPDAIHAFGWTAAAVALGALPNRFASRTLVTLQDPIRKNEMPKGFIEKRLPELLTRSRSVHCAYETLRRVLVETLGVPADKVSVVPYGIDASAVVEAQRPADRSGPIVGYSGRLESDRAWEIAIDAVARVAKAHPQAGIVFGRSGPIAGLVKSHARGAGLREAALFLDDAPVAELFARIDMLAVPSSFDGLPYALVEALVAGVPVIGADAAGVADTLGPYEAWLVPDDERGFGAGIEEAWSGIDAAWAAARAQRSAAQAVFSRADRNAELLAVYESMSLQPAGSIVALG